MSSTNRSDARVGLRLALALALLSAPSAATAAVTLVGATPAVGWGGQCGFLDFSDFTCPSLVEGTSIAHDHTFGTSKVVVEATASTKGPVASVQGEDSGPIFIPGSAEARVDYEFAVTPVGAGLVLHVSSVPVTVTGNAEAHASGNADAWAFARALTPLGPIEDCVNLPGICVGPQAATLSGSVTPNEPIDLYVVAAGNLAGNPSDFRASADPVFTIADELIPGTDINYRDAFSVVLSPNVTQSTGQGAAIPEPATSALFAAGLAGLWLWRRRKGAEAAGNITYG